MKFTLTVDMIIRKELIYNVDNFSVSHLVQMSGMSLRLWFLKLHVFFSKFVIGEIYMKLSSENIIHVNLQVFCELVRKRIF